MPGVRHWLPATAAVCLTACATGSPDTPQAGQVHDARNPHASHTPVFRFAVYDKRMADFQYIGTGEGKERRMKKRFPQTRGPMPVDCESFVEFGVTLKNRRHKFQFAVTDAWDEPINERHFTYRRWLRSGTLAGQVRFRERPEDGVYKIVVSHRGQILHEEKFRLDGCTDDSKPGTIQNLAHLGNPERIEAGFARPGTPAPIGRIL